MKKYLIDTNIISYLDDFRSPFQNPVINRLSSLSADDAVHISILTLYELQYSIFRSVPDMKPKITQTVNFFTKRFPIINLSAHGAYIFGNIKSIYKEKSGLGKNELDKHNIDFIIASTAIAEDAIMVSNDAIFTKVKEIHPGFRLENWTQL